MDDPRIYFAAERTLLAWIRTSITMIALGFIVARFGIFLDMVHAGDPTHGARQHLSIIIGIGLIVVGMVINIMSLVQFSSFKKTLTKDQMPQSYNSAIAIFASLAMTATCLLLIVYLLKSQGG